MKRLSLTLVVVLTLAFGSMAFAQQQVPLTKEQITERLQNIQLEKRYLELRVEEMNLQQALKNMEAAKVPEKAEKKK